MYIEVRDIRKSYGKKSILSGVSFAAGEGSCVGILGANGSGKSTLLNIMSGIIRPDGGSFFADGANLFKSTKLRQTLVGYVPQQTPLIRELSAYDNLLMWYDSKAIRGELEGGVLGLLGIGEFLNKPVSKLSGGMEKRLTIGCAVSGKPKILIMDEPSAALDIVCREKIYDYLKHFTSCGGIIVLATHDYEEINLCSELYILKNGTLLPYEFDGDTSRLAGLLQ